MKTLIRLLVSVATSLVVLALLFGLASALGANASAGDILTGLRAALPVFVGAYAICQLLQALARAQRSRVLLRASMPAGTAVPSLFHTLLVTFVRGACADMLPARLGELSYVAMLNRGCDVPAADCLSSLSVGLLFDFLALLAVLGAAIPAAAQGMSLVGAAIVLAIVCALGVVCLFWVLPFVAAWHWERLRLFRWRPLAWLLRLAREVAESVVKVRRGRVAGRVALLSLAVRAAKYVGLCCLFVAVTRPLWPALSRASVPAVLVALIAAEGAASLPVPTFLSFGSYEAGGLAALTALGFPAGDSLTAMMTMHVLSQIIDYSLGGAAFLLFTWCTGPKRDASSATPSTKPRRRTVAAVILLLAVCAAAVLFAAFQWRAAKKRGRLTAPPKGEAVTPTSEESAARDAALAAFGGKIVWSSNRSGSHDLWLLESGSAAPRRLTHSTFTDTYPRLSPDGTRVLFSRSTQPWVSQRNFDLWDTWLLDLATGEERLIATNAYQAVWGSWGDTAYFVRGDGAGRDGGIALVAVSLDPAAPAEKTLLQSGVPPLDAGVLVTLPDFQSGSPQFALTFRGAKKKTGTYSLEDAAFGGVPPIRYLAGGCQMIWKPDGSHAINSCDTPVWVDHPGRMKNAIYSWDQEHEDKPNVLLDAPDPWSHEYFPHFDASGRWLVYGASTGGHEQDVEDYEIFLWDSATPAAPPVRLTFHTGNDCWPDLR